jgi:hypothetical protein
VGALARARLKLGLPPKLVTHLVCAPLAAPRPHHSVKHVEVRRHGHQGAALLHTARRGWLPVSTASALRSQGQF